MGLSRTEKFLCIFTEVKAGEGKTALLMFANVFLILLAYYFIKPIREGWIAVSDIQGLTKVEVKAYSSFFQSILLLAIVGWYARLSDRWPKIVLFTRATWFCVANIVIFWILQPDFFFGNLPFTGFIYYLWVGIFGVFVVAQFWTFCADVYTDESGKRMLPFIAIGATSGAALGALSVELLVEHHIVPTEWLLLVATLPLMASINLMKKVDRREDYRHQQSAIDVIDKSMQRASLWVGTKLIWSSKFLLLTALITLVSNWVNTNGENLLFSVVQFNLTQQAIEQKMGNDTLQFVRDGTTIFYGTFYFWVNVLATLLQAFVASRLLKIGGFAAILLILPVIALLSYSFILLLPIIYIIKMMKIVENATDYSINNTSRQVLWLPVNSETKFHAKPAIDTLYVRLGDGLAALTVLIGIHILALPLGILLAFNLSLVAVWLLIGVLLVREYRRVKEANSQVPVEEDTT